MNLWLTYNTSTSLHEQNWDSSLHLILFFVLSNDYLWLITSKIKLVVYIMCVYCLLCIYKYPHIHDYILENYVVYILNIFMYSMNYMNRGCDFSDTDFRIFRPLKDNPCDLRRSGLVFFFKRGGGGGGVGWLLHDDWNHANGLELLHKLWKDCFLKHHGRTGPESAARARGAICRTVKSVRLIQSASRISA